MQILEELEVVDTKLALDMIGGYEQVYHKVVNCFLETNANLINDIIHNLKNDLNEARRLVHSCKGISENIGSKRLHEVSMNFELAIINRDDSLINEHLSEFQTVFNAVMRDLKRIKF